MERRARKKRPGAMERAARRMGIGTTTNLCCGGWVMHSTPIEPAARPLLARALARNHRPGCPELAARLVEMYETVAPSVPGYPNLRVRYVVDSPPPKD